MKTVKIRLTHKDARSLMMDPNTIITTDNEILARSYAKLYYRGGGWWIISGYSQDGNDVGELLLKLSWRR